MDPQTVTLTSFFTNILGFFGASPVAFTGLNRVAANTWLGLVVLAYLASFAGLAFVVWLLMRIFDLRRRENEFYETLVAAPESAQAASPRFERIKELASGGSPSEWREAIIEADIMLDDLLSGRGYTGLGVGEKLMQIERSSLASLNDAWEAHKVRNQIAHEGSLFDLSATLAARTIARYESVFRELGGL